jgi:hypothetical protein
MEGGGGYLIRDFEEKVLSGDVKKREALEMGVSLGTLRDS